MRWMVTMGDTDEGREKERDFGKKLGNLKGLTRKVATKTRFRVSEGAILKAEKLAMFLFASLRVIAGSSYIWHVTSTRPPSIRHTVDLSKST